MRRISILFCAAAIAAVACNKAELEQPQVEESVLRPMTFTATTSDTRTSLDENGASINWSTEDIISVFDGQGNRPFSSTGSGRTVTFNGNADPDATNYYALYPFNGEATISGTTVTTTLPANQDPEVGTFANGLNISAAKTTGGSTEFHFSNVMSVAKFTIDSDALNGKTIKTVKFSSSHPLAGDVLINYGETITASAGTNTVNEITLTKTEGFDEGTYYFVVLPNEGGPITMTFESTDGSTASKSATLGKSFTAGVIKNLGTVGGLEWTPPTEKIYTKVTSNDDLVSGQYLIVYEEGSVAFNGGRETLDAASNTIEVLMNNGTIPSNTETDAASFTISIAGNNSTIKSASGYYIGQTSDANGLASSTTVAYTNSITIDSEGNAVILSSGGAYLRYNNDNGQKRFRYFKSSTYTGQKVVSLFKLTEVAPDNRTPVTLTFTPAEPEAITLGDEFTEPTLTVEPAAAASLVTYSVSSEPEGIATINNGQLEITGAGTITVTASIADGDETYKPASASYTLTVNAGHGESADNPYTVAEALAIIDALETVGSTGRTDTRYVTGIISDVISYNSQYHSITYNITDDGNNSSPYIQVYSGKGLNGANFSSENDLSIGDEVVIAGDLMKYQKGEDIIPQIYQSSRIVSRIHIPIITITQPTQEGCSIAASVDGSTILTGARIETGKTVTLTATVGNGFTFNGWSVVGASISDASATSTTFVVGSSDVTVSASFVADVQYQDFTWNLSTDNTVTKTDTELGWNYRGVTMVVAKGNSSINANNYCPPYQNSTRFYTGFNLTITPYSGSTIGYVEFTATTANFASALANSAWTNASATVTGTKVTVTPTNGTDLFSATIGANCGFTSVKVYYTGNLASLNVTDISVEDYTPTYTVSETGTYAFDGKVYAVYSDDSKVQLFANDYTVTGTVDLTTAGTYNLTIAATIDGTLYSKVIEITVNSASGNTSTLTFTAACGGSGTADDGVSWTVTSDGTESSFDSTKGIHYGTSSAAVQYIQLSTSGISGTITKVVVNASTASGVAATVGVTVNGNSFGGDPKSLSSTASDYTFEGSASGEIIVTVTKPSSATKALYVKSVEVTYTPSN